MPLFQQVRTTTGLLNLATHRARQAKPGFTQGCGTRGATGEKPDRQVGQEAARGNQVIRWVAAATISPFSLVTSTFASVRFLAASMLSTV